MPKKRLVGGIELGGTKSLVAVGYDDGTILERTSLPTIAPEYLIPQIAEFFRSHRDGIGQIEALGVGAFGPIVVAPKAQNYGKLLQTNKLGWSNFDLATAISSAIGLTPHIVTDVASAGIAEAALGALRGYDLGIYLTVGTGIGGAIQRSAISRCKDIATMSLPHAAVSTQVAQRVSPLAQQYWRASDSHSVTFPLAVQSIT